MKLNHIYIQRLVLALLPPSAHRPRIPLVRRVHFLTDAATCLAILIFFGTFIFLPQRLLSQREQGFFFCFWYGPLSVINSAKCSVSAALQSGSQVGY